MYQIQNPSLCHLLEAPKSSADFQSNSPLPNPGSYFAHSHQSKTFNPYVVAKPSYEFGQKTTFLHTAAGQQSNPNSSAGKLIQNGIRLVGLANSPNDSK